jgi:manganese/zinc/iron transport system ATP- binding protein
MSDGRASGEWEPGQIRTERSARITISDLTLHFEDRPALEQINLNFYPSEVVSLVGPNGAGKSTLMRVLAGILPPSHGFVWLEERPLTGPDPCVVYVPQRSTVDWSFPINVQEVVMLASRESRSRLLPFRAHDRERAIEALRTVGMEHHLHVQISRLSGGQQQRVFLARALFQAGDVYLLDEPFAGVDIPTQDLLNSVLRDLATEGKTIVFATHDLQQAYRASDRIVLLNRRVIADGPPLEVLRPERLLRAFGGEAAVLPSELVRTN